MKTVTDTLGEVPRGFDSKTAQSELCTRRDVVVRLCEEALRRRLSYNERICVLNARACWVCFADGRAGVKLVACTLCWHAYACAGTCTAAFSVLHPRKCKACTDIAVSVAVNQLPLSVLADGTRLPIVYVPARLEACYMPLMLPQPEARAHTSGASEVEEGSWGDEDAVPRTDDVAPEDRPAASIRSVAGLGWPSFVARYDWPDFSPVVMTAMLAPLSFPLTIVHCLELCMPASISSASRVVVHVVGAQLVPELFSLTRYELLLHLLPSMTDVHLRFVGSGLADTVRASLPASLLPGGLDTALSTGTDGLCETCKDAGRRLRIGFSCGHYDSMIARSAEWPAGCDKSPPDVIVLFNPTFAADSAGWSAALLKLPVNTPVFVTSSCNEDAIEHARCLRACGFRLCDGYPAQNPFRYTVAHALPERMFRHGWLNDQLSWFVRE